jgi:low affinity Fe/Cu permease
LNEWFNSAADKVSQWAGSPWFFFGNLLVVLVWIIWGVIAGFSDTHQLIMTTGLTVTTQLLIILVQNTQNRQARVERLQQAELLRAVADARTELARAEEMSEDEIENKIQEIKEDA